VRLLGDCRALCALSRQHRAALRKAQPGARPSVQEVVQHLADSTATVEIAAGTPSGFNDAVIRTVTENARTLHFTDQGFEDE
jgi:hypothetical protein